MKTDSAKMSVQALSEHRMAEPYQGASPNARFLAGTLATSETSWKSFLLRSSWSVVMHVAGLMLLVYLLTRPGAFSTLAKVIDTPDITWVAMPGPGGGGGGGGNKQPDPPRKAEITPPKIVWSSRRSPNHRNQSPSEHPRDHLGCRAAGAATSCPANGSPGRWHGRWRRNRHRYRCGAWHPLWFWRGFGGGTGGGYTAKVWRSSPVLFRELKPKHTGEAMRARIQGTVTVDAVVLPDGSVADARIPVARPAVRLDKEALKPSKWRSSPSAPRAAGASDPDRLSFPCLRTGSRAVTSASDVVDRRDHNLPNSTDRLRGGQSPRGRLMVLKRRIIRSISRLIRARLAVVSSGAAATPRNRLACISRGRSHRAGTRREVKPEYTSEARKARFKDGDAGCRSGRGWYGGEVKVTLSPDEDTDWITCRQGGEAWRFSRTRDGKPVPVRVRSR